MFKKSCMLLVVCLIILNIWITAPTFAHRGMESCVYLENTIHEIINNGNREVTCCANPYLVDYIDDSGTHINSGRICKVALYKVTRCYACGTTYKRVFIGWDEHPAETCPYSGLLSSQDELM